GLEARDGADGALEVGRREWQPEFTAIPAEPRRHHAENRVRRVVERDGAADGGGVAVVETLPEFETQDGDGLRFAVRLEVACRDGAPDHRWHAEKFEGGGGQTCGA